MDDTQKIVPKRSDEKERNRQPVVVELDILDVPKVDDLISSLTRLRRQDRIPDLLLLLGYSPCLCVGARRFDDKDLLKPMAFFIDHDVPFYKSARGGGLTYHWPGQLVCYPILKLTRAEQNIPRYMFLLEEIALRTLAAFGVQAERKRDKTAQIGLWVGEDKNASMGIRISQWVTAYGFALNLSGDTAISRYIRPCGLDVKLLTVEQHTGNVPKRSLVGEKVVACARDVLNRPFVSWTPKNSDELCKVFEEHGINICGT